jgi:hypothetical protein
MLIMLKKKKQRSKVLWPVLFHVQRTGFEKGGIGQRVFGNGMVRSGLLHVRYFFVAKRVTQQKHRLASLEFKTFQIKYLQLLSE